MESSEGAEEVTKTGNGSTSPSSTKPRRFAVEPTETSSKTTRKFAPQPVETTTKTTRKFAVDPVETSSKSSKEGKSAQGSTSPKQIRRFAPEPVESTKKTSRNAVSQSAESVENNSHTQSTKQPAMEAKSSQNIVSGSTETMPKNSQDSSSITKETTIKSDAQFSSPFWKKVQKNLNQEAEPIGTKTSAQEARQLEQKQFWDKVERGMVDNEASSAEVSSAPVKSFKPLSFWEKVQKKIEEPAEPAPLEPIEKPAASLVAGSFWSKVSKNMDGGSMDSGVGDVTPKPATEFTPLSFWDKVSKKIDGVNSPDSGLGDMGSTPGTTSPAKASVVPFSFWDKVSKNMSDTGTSEDARGRPTTQSSTRRFTPQMISTSKRSYRKSWMDEEDDEIPLLPHERGVQPASFSSSPGSSPARRRFAPQLIETAKRTHKGGDKPKLPPRDKIVGSLDSGSSSNALSAENAPSAIPSHIAELLNRSNQGPQRKRYPTRRNTRGHSFKVPELESIDSSESEEETTGPPSYSSSHADLAELIEHNFKHATRIRESVDDRFAGYLLRLAAQAAQKQLQEQAEAAFPNSEFHEPVNHYMDRESDESDQETSPAKRVASRTQSLIHNHRRQALTRNNRQRNDSDEERIALEELQKHHERLSEEKNRSDKDDPWSAPEALKKAQAALQLTKQRDAEARQMRKAASPPMLGGDITFPRCRSPEPARFDVTQGSDFLRNSMCALTQQANEKSGLWVPSKPAERLISSKRTDNTGSGVSSRQGSSSANNGLWGGFCTTQDTKLSPMPTGLQTPMYTPAKEKEDPFAAFSVVSTSSTGIAGTAGRRPGAKRLASTSKPPLAALAALSAANDKLELEAKVNTEFTDDFVTQVYNYLSLGYPSLARKFDEELSHIARIDINELRQDDKLAEAKGYVRLGEDADKDSGVDETMCARWRALRLYIREWGRQQASFAGPEPLDPHRAWGLTARRGSWGL